MNIFVKNHDVNEFVSDGDSVLEKIYFAMFPNADGEPVLEMIEILVENIKVETFDITVDQFVESIIAHHAKVRESMKDDHYELLWIDRVDLEMIRAFVEMRKTYRFIACDESQHDLNTI